MKMTVSVYDSTGALIGGELEAKSKKKNKPLWARADLDDLIARLIGKTNTKDEGAGHPFHGNQYVEVAGQQVSVPTTGSVKEKLHNLFAQGHKFTLKELAALLGQSEVTLRGRLSEIKKAAPAGGLILEKNGEHYSIKKKDLMDDDIPMDVPLSVKEKETLAAALSEVQAPTPAPESVVAPPVPPEPVPEPVVEPKQTLAEKTLPEVGTFDPPATGPMPKAQADKVYEDKLKSWADAVQTGGIGGEDVEVDPDAIDALAQGWKNTKANAMAEWKSNTTGTAVIAKPQQVFAADKQLVKDVIAGDSLKTAIAKWKTNTQNEKNGSWPVDPEKVKMAALAKAEAEKAAHLAGEEYKKKQVAELAAKEAAIADAYKEHGPHFATVPNYVPHDHAGINADDVIDESFEKGIMSVQAKLFNDSQGDQGNKIEVQHAIEARLTSSKAFQSLVAQRGMIGSFNGSLAAQLVAAWAGSSGGANPISNAMQLAIRDAFEMKHADVAYDALKVLSGTGGNEEMLYHKAAASLSVKYETPEQKATVRSAMRDFVLAQYHNTQDVFKAKGITHVYVARGSGGNVGVMKDDAATHGHIKLQPASSFSTNMPTAHGFAGGDSVYMVKVPTSQVLGSACSGYGCTGEFELVVLAHPKTSAIRIPASKAYSLDQATHHVKQTIKTGPSMSAEAIAKYEAAKKGQPKTKKPTVHVHVHSELPTAADKQLAKDVIAGDSLKTAIAKWKTNTQNEKNGSWPVDPEKVSVEFNEPSKSVPSWFKQHPMHNEAKYHEMVAKGKTPIQIKHYYGSLKHAAIKKLPGVHA